MSRRKRRALALGILFVTFACLQCAEKEGSVSPYIETEPPQYRIQYLEVVPVRVDPGGTADVEVRVVDLDNDPVVGHDLVFEVTYGAIESPGITDENGIVRVVYTAPYGTVQETIRATGRSLVPKEVFLQVGAGALEASPMSILADGMSYSMLSIDLVNQSGAPVKGALITWDVDPAKGVITDAVSRTDSTGQASAVLVSLPSVNDVVATVTAWITYGDVEPYAEVVDVDMRGVSVLVVADPDDLPADGTSVSYVAAWVGETTSGVPLATVPVTFTTTLGAIDAMAYTNANGVAAVYLYSPTSPGVATVVASYGLMTGTAYVTFGGLAINVTAELTRMPADGLSSQYVTATLLGEGNNPVSGVSVDFATSDGVITGSAVTDFYGNADVLLTSADYPATATVIASFGDALADTVQVTFVGLNLTLKAQMPKMVADGISSQTVRTTLVTQDGNPVEGASIQLTTSAGMIAGSAITNSYGKAEAELTSASTVGSATVAASYRGLYQDAIVVGFETPVIVLKATPMAISADPANISLITAYVSFTDGSPVPDGTPVTFSTTEGTITPSSATGSGIADVELVPTGIANSNVTVRASSGAAGAATQVVFAPDVASFVSAYALPDSLPGDGSSTATIVAEVTDEYGNRVADGTVVSFTVSAGNGIVTPIGLTVGGIATAKFIPTGGSATATVTAMCEKATHDVGIRLLSGSSGAIVADPDTAWIAVAGTWDESQVTVLAHVYDSHSNPVADGTDVSFTIQAGPGGGEYLNDPADGYGPIIKPTFGGVASITVNSGTKPGTVLMTITSGDYAAAATKIGISAGDPDSILLQVGEVVINGDGTYTLGVSAIVRDQFNNPVENGTAVYFTLDRSDLGFINPETYTGSSYPCAELSGDPIKGITRACLTYGTESIFEYGTIIASTWGGETQSSASYGITLPIVDAALSIEAFPSSLSGAAGGVVNIQVVCWDHYNLLPVDKAYIGFSIEGAGSVSPYFGTTDESGSAYTTVTIPPGTEEGTTTVKAKLFMTTVEAAIDITITP
ncbi:MAG: invasin domain 3-containing protein [Candidatus Eisenbacteria bacterium]